MTVKISNLGAAEAGRLTICEKVIARGIASFVQVGRALTEIRDAKLYRATHKTFEAYCKDRWEIGRSRAYELIDHAEVVDTIYSGVDLSAAADISKRDIRAIKGDLPVVAHEIRSRVAAGEEPAKAVAEAIAAKRAEKAGAKRDRDARQAESDRKREQARAALPEHIRRVEEAKAKNGSRHAAVTGAIPEPIEATEQIKAHRDELVEENVALRADVADLTRKLAVYDDRAVLWEKGGLDAIEENYRQQIRALEQRVEDATTDRAVLARSRDFWKKQAMALGYVSPNSQVVDDEPGTSGAPEYEVF